jgi:hypothetical protein
LRFFGIARELYLNGYRCLKRAGEQAFFYRIYDKERSGKLNPLCNCEGKAGQAGKSLLLRPCIRRLQTQYRGGARGTAGHKVAQVAREDAV